MKTLVKQPNVKGALEYFKAKSEFSTGPVEVHHMIQESLDDINIIDVRSDNDYRQAHIPHAHSLPQDRWESLEGLSKNKTNILYCYTQTCHLAAKAAAFFAEKGYPVMEMDGGFKAWRENEFETEKSY